MISIYISLLISSYLLSASTTNAAQQKIEYNSALLCYGENAAGIFVARQNESRVETAVCEFPTKTSCNSSIHYTLPYMVNGTSQRVPITIELDETITRNDTTKPLSYVIQSDGVVTSQAFNGYHALLLVISSNYSAKCDDTVVFDTLLLANTYMAVFPASLSGQALKDITFNLTYTDNYAERAHNIHYWFTNTLNSTGMVCSGDTLIDYSGSE